LFVDKMLSQRSREESLEETFEFSMGVKFPMIMTRALKEGVGKEGR